MPMTSPKEDLDRPLLSEEEKDSDLKKRSEEIDDKSPLPSQSQPQEATSEKPMSAQDLSEPTFDEKRSPVEESNIPSKDDEDADEIASFEEVHALEAPIESDPSQPTETTEPTEPTESLEEPITSENDEEEKSVLEEDLSPEDSSDTKEELIEEEYVQSVYLNLEEISPEQDDEVENIISSDISESGKANLEEPTEIDEEEKSILEEDLVPLDSNDTKEKAKDEEPFDDNQLEPLYVIEKDLEEQWCSFCASQKSQTSHLQDLLTNRQGRVTQSDGSIVLESQLECESLSLEDKMKELEGELRKLDDRTDSEDEMRKRLDCEQLNHQSLKLAVCVLDSIEGQILLVHLVAEKSLEDLDRWKTQMRTLQSLSLDLMSMVADERREAAEKGQEYVIERRDLLETYIRDIEEEDLAEAKALEEEKKLLNRLANCELILQPLCDLGNSILDESHYVQLPSVELTPDRLNWESEIIACGAPQLLASSCEVDLLQHYKQLLDELENYLKVGWAELFSEEERFPVETINQLQQVLCRHKKLFDCLNAQRDRLEFIHYQLSHSGKKSSLEERQRYLLMESCRLEESSQNHRSNLLTTISTWNSFKKLFGDLSKWLIHTSKYFKSKQPEVSKSSETIINSPDREEMLADIEQQIQDRRGEFQEVMNVGGKLIQLCHGPPDIEKELNNLSEAWSRISEAVTEEKESLSDYTKLSNEFHSLANRLEEFIRHQRQRLVSERRIQSGRKGIHLESLETMRIELHANMPLKQDALETGEQLLRCSQVKNPPRLAADLEKFQEDWQLLMAEYEELEVKLVGRVLNEENPSEVCKDLLDWCSHHQSGLRQTLTRVAQTPRDVEMLIERFRDFQLMRTMRLPIYDTVKMKLRQGDRASRDLVQQLDDCWNDSKLFATEDYIDAYQQVHSSWKNLEMELIHLGAQISECDSHVTHLNKAYPHRALEESSMLSDQLSQYYSQLHDIKRQFTQLIEQTRSSCPSLSIAEDEVTLLVTNIECEQSRVSGRVLDEIAHLDNLCQLWNRFEHCLSEVDCFTEECGTILNDFDLVTDCRDKFDAIHLLNRFKWLSDSINSGDGCVAKLKKILDDLKSTKNAKLIERAKQLTAPLFEQLKNFPNELSSKIESLKSLISDWRTYEDKVTECDVWLAGRESLTADLLHQPLNNLSDMKLQEMAGQCGKIRDDLATFYSNQVTSLCSQSQKLTSVDCDRYYLINRQAALCEKVRILTDELNKKLRQLEKSEVVAARLEEAVQNIEAFLNRATETIGDCGSVLLLQGPLSVQQRADCFVTIETLQNLLRRFVDNRELYNTIRTALQSQSAVEFSTSISDTMANSLAEIMASWKQRRQDALNHLNNLQRLTEIHEEEDKLESSVKEWTEVLNQIQYQLTQPCSDNLSDLRKQQILLEDLLFTSDFKSSNLQEIILECESLSSSSNIDLDKGHQIGKLCRLIQEHWSVLEKHTRHKRDQVENILAYWESVEVMFQRLNQWIELMDEKLNIFDFQVTSVANLHILWTHLHSIREAIDHQQHNYQNYISCSKLLETVLSQSTPLDSQTESKSSSGRTVASNRRHSLSVKWSRILNTIERCQGRLEELQKDWENVNSEIVRTENWLSEVRSLYESSLLQKMHSIDVQKKDTLPKIQEDIQIVTSLKEHLRRFDCDKFLLSQISEDSVRLSASLSFEDSYILSERIAVMSRQWDCLQEELKDCCRAIEGKLDQWRLFEHDCSEFVTLVEDLREKVTGETIDQEDHPQVFEDMIDNCKKYKRELEYLTSFKEEVAHNGQTLALASDDVQANQIHDMTKKINNLWRQTNDVLETKLSYLESIVNNVIQLDEGLNDLRKWILSMETSLSYPIIYDSCDYNEIQKKLFERKQLDTEIQKHISEVSALHNLSLSLAQSDESYPSATKRERTEKAVTFLHDRLRTMSEINLKKQTEIEETWTLWENLKKRLYGFDNWLLEFETKCKVDYIQIEEDLSLIQDLHKDAEKQLNSLQELDDHLRHLEDSHRVDTAGQLRDWMNTMLHRVTQAEQYSRAIEARLENAANMKKRIRKTRCQVGDWCSSIGEHIRSERSSSDVSEECSVAYQDLQLLSGHLPDQVMSLNYLDNTILGQLYCEDRDDMEHINQEWAVFCDSSLSLLTQWRDALIVLDNREAANQVEEFMNNLNSLNPNKVVPPPHNAPRDFYSTRNPIQTHRISRFDRLREEERPHLSSSHLSARCQSLDRIDPGTSCPSPGWKDESRFYSSQDLSPEYVTPFGDLPSHQRKHHPEPWAPTSKIALNSERREPLVPFDDRTEQLVNLEATLDTLENLITKVHSLLNEAEANLRCRTPSSDDEVRFINVDYTLPLEKCSQMIHTARNLERTIKTDTGLSRMVGGSTIVQAADDRLKRLFHLADKKTQRLESNLRGNSSSIEIPSERSVQMPFLRDSKPHSIEMSDEASVIHDVAFLRDLIQSDQNNLRPEQLANLISTQSATLSISELHSRLEQVGKLVDNYKSREEMRQLIESKINSTKFSTENCREIIAATDRDMKEVKDLIGRAVISTEKNFNRSAEFQIWLSATSCHLADSLSLIEEMESHLNHSAEDEMPLTSSVKESLLNLACVERSLVAVQDKVQQWMRLTSPLSFSDSPSEELKNSCLTLHDIDQTILQACDKCKSIAENAASTVVRSLDIPGAASSEYLADAFMESIGVDKRPVHEEYLEESESEESSLDGELIDKSPLDNWESVSPSYGALLSIPGASSNPNSSHNRSLIERALTPLFKPQSTFHATDVQIQPIKTPKSHSLPSNSRRRGRRRKSSTNQIAKQPPYSLRELIYRGFVASLPMDLLLLTILALTFYLQPVCEDACGLTFPKLRFHWPEPPPM